MNVVAALINKGDRILITKRKQGSYMAGRWEFPGGKVEAGEKPREALMREIKEELCLEIDIDDLFCAKQHIYDLGSKKRRVKLSFYEAHIVGGEIECIGCDEYVWATRKELKDYDFVDGDAEIVRKLAE
jgi:8-oxo-dGTP diphosphatase